MPPLQLSKVRKVFQTFIHSFYILSLGRLAKVTEPRVRVYSLTLAFRPNQQRQVKKAPSETRLTLIAFL